MPSTGPPPRPRSSPPPVPKPPESPIRTTGKSFVTGWAHQLDEGGELVPGRSEGEWPAAPAQPTVPGRGTPVHAENEGKGRHGHRLQGRTGVFRQHRQRNRVLLGESHPVLVREGDGPLLQPEIRRQQRFRRAVGGRPRRGRV